MIRYKVLSIGTLGNSRIDIDASASNEWCSGLFFKPREGSDRLISENGVDIEEIDFRNYDTLLVWHQALPEPLLSIVKRAVKMNPSMLIIGNSHGYNKSIPELYRYYKLKVPQLYMDYYSMWGPYFTHRYQEVFGVNSARRNILSLGSLRHDYLFKHFRWNRNKTNGKVLLIHEPVSSEGWSDPSPVPIGDNRVSDSILDVLQKFNIPFDFKVHPNWPDFISNTGKKMWSPPPGVRIVNISIVDMLKYEAIIASWSSIQFEALSMGIPIINVEYTYPTVHDSEWGPGKYGLLNPVKPEQIPDSLEKSIPERQAVDLDLLKYFLGDLGYVSDGYYQFITSKSGIFSRMNRRVKRVFGIRTRQTRTVFSKMKEMIRRSS